MSRIDLEPKDDEVFLVELVSIHPDHIILNMRVRGDNSWMYMKRLRLEEGYTFVFADNAETEHIPNHFWLNQWEKIPRGENVDIDLEIP
jgi:hypothetical protein